MTPLRWAALAALGGALLFALQGGEFSTWDLVRLRRQERAERAQVAALQQAVDSLGKAASAIEHDPRVQERVARESFGMIRKGEFLYKLVPAEAGDSASR
ncbi:MAG TPA: septum formation initiator family protein [Gemmatimonadales bacterium]|nr:septum formation initiator family protein [Gemmatimonadales bacterium]